MGDMGLNLDEELSFLSCNQGGCGCPTRPLAKMTGISRFDIGVDDPVTFN